MVDAARFASIVLAAWLAGCAGQPPAKPASGPPPAIDQAKELQRVCRYDEAAALLEAAIPTATPGDRDELMLMLGSVLEHRGDLQGALARYQQVAASERISLEALRLLGMAQVRDRQYEAGRRHLNAYAVERVRLQGQPPEQLIAALAVAHAELGDLEKARKLLDSALENLDSTNALLLDLRERAQQKIAGAKPVPGEFWTLAYGSDEAVSAMDLDHPPVPVHRVPPWYPRAAAQDRIEGRVDIRLRVDASGAVRDAQVVSSNPPGVFDHAALTAVRQWRFRAGTRRCVAAEAVTRQRISFALER